MAPNMQTIGRCPPAVISPKGTLGGNSLFWYTARILKGEGLYSPHIFVNNSTIINMATDEIYRTSVLLPDGESSEWHDDKGIYLDLESAKKGQTERILKNPGFLRIAIIDTRDNVIYIENPNNKK